jgi:hypothetical protein
MAERSANPEQDHDGQFCIRGLRGPFNQQWPAAIVLIAASLFLCAGTLGSGATGNHSLPERMNERL